MWCSFASFSLWIFFLFSSFMLFGFMLFWSCSLCLQLVSTSFFPFLGLLSFPFFGPLFFSFWLYQGINLGFCWWILPGLRIKLGPVWGGLGLVFSSCRSPLSPLAFPLGPRAVILSPQNHRGLCLYRETHSIQVFWYVFYISFFSHPLFSILR